ncbi:aminoacyl-tRNA hydrolase [Aestuariicella sp. G3-2]|uniref:aminoacyl-tRNA hydrolase n=1 Tax=Pseudomaricurvus albidus TaxID=2842452 RepID=UPI001C0C102C|nr:aminoacyl-tRNA hydrolase [Aestuariicella albida]MBU3070738.1 aminoacyl-tRNA hydrolase [Aestuariicella albida]
MDTPIQLIVGLGNPGSEYDQTRHNAGADFVTELARQCGASLTPEKKFFGNIAQVSIDNRPIRLLIPATYMNRSGQSVSALANFYKIPPEAILVAHDELDMPPGVAKLKIGGGHGGHNGLRDIISSLGNNNGFARLRIGIGHPGNAKQVASYVLKKAPADEFNKTEDSIYAACKVMPQLTRGEWNAAMKELHSS